MSIEIRHLSISSSVVQRAADEDGNDAGAEREEDQGKQALPEHWRAECRRIVRELLDARKER